MQQSPIYTVASTSYSAFASGYKQTGGGQFTSDKDITYDIKDLSASCLPTKHPYR